MGLETLRSRGKILTDIAQNKSPEVSPKDIVSNHVTASVQNLIGNYSPCSVSVQLRSTGSVSRSCTSIIIIAPILRLDLLLRCCFVISHKLLPLFRHWGPEPV